MGRPILCALIATVFVPSVFALGTTVIPSPVYVQLVATVYTSKHANGTCDNIDPESMQNIEAVRWTIEQLNKNSYFPWSFDPGDPQLGLQVSHLCGSKDEAIQLAYDLTVEMNSSDTGMVGVIGPDFSSDVEATSRLLSALPSKYRPLQLGYSATSAKLDNKDIYKNFFRTIPPDNVQTEVMIKLAMRLNWTYIGIIYDDDIYGRGGKDALLEEVTTDICFPVLIPVDTIDYNVQNLENEIKNNMINASIPVGGAIVFGSYTLARTVLTATENLRSTFPNATLPNFIFSEAAGYLEGQAINASKGIFVLSPPRRTIQEFQTHWKSLFTDVQNIDNLPAVYSDWLRDVYEKAFECKPTVNNVCPAVSEAKVQEELPPSVYTQYAIQTTMVMAKVTYTVHKQKCPNTNRCNNFIEANKQDFIDAISGLRVDFDNDFGGMRIDEFKNPDLIITFNTSTEAFVPAGFPLYEIYNHKVCSPGQTCFAKVAELTSTMLNVQTDEIKDYDSSGNEKGWLDIRKAQCPHGYTCSSCNSRSFSEASIFYEPGDLYVVGIAPVHNPGVTPLQCGDIKLGVLDVVEVIRFAVQDAKDNIPEKIPQGSIGVIIIDSCNDPHIVQEKVLTLHRLGVLVDGQYIPVADKILGYIGGWSSSVSTDIADIMSRLKFVQISYGSTATSLSDELLFPFFLRVPTPDNFQAELMLKLVQELNSNLIQIVYSDSTYGRGGRDTLRSLVGHYGICVAKEHAVIRNTDPLQLMSSLRQYGDARLVIMFIGSFEAEMIAQPFSDNLKQNEFIFINSEGWGTRFSGLTFRNLVGTISLAPELPVNEKFKDHLRDLKPDGSNLNPWIRPYMESYFQCYYQWSYDKMSNSPCTGDESIDVFNTDYRVDVWAPFAERAVLSLLQGSRVALDNLCGSSTKICNSYRSNPKVVFNATKVLEFTDESGNIRNRAYRENGDGRAGYRIYSISSTGDYIRVGSSEFQTEVSEISFQRSSYPGPANLNSTCKEQNFCQVCFPTQSVEEKKDSLSLGLIVVIVILAAICCVLAGFLLFVCNRLGCCLKFDNGRPKLNDNYLSPVYVKRTPGEGMVEMPELQGNYDSIGYPYLHATSGGGSSGGRRLPGAPGEGRSDGTAGTSSSGTKVSGGSYISSGNSIKSGSHSNTSQGSYIRPVGHPSVQETGPNVALTPGPVVYQQDGSYITAADHMNQGFQTQPEETNVSDQSMRQLSTDSDKSLGYLRSPQRAGD